VLDVRLRARLRIGSRMGTVLFSIRPSLLLPRDVTPGASPAFCPLTLSGRRHRRFPQTPLGLHGRSSLRRQTLPGHIHCRQLLPIRSPWITPYNHSRPSRRARGRRPSLQIHKSRVYNHCWQAISSTGITSSIAVRFLGLKTIHVCEESAQLYSIGDIGQVCSGKA